MTARQLLVESTGKPVGKIAFDDEVITAEGAAESIVDARRRRGLGDAEIWDQLDGWSNGYLLFSQAPTKTVKAKFDKNQLRNDQGEWTAVGGGVGGGLDKLKLGKRIKLGEDEKLVASGKYSPALSPNEALFAAIDTPTGRQLRIGIIREEDRGNWRAANRGATVQLDAAAVEQLDQKLADVAKEAGRIRKEYGTLVAKLDGVEWDYNTDFLPPYDHSSMTDAEFHEFSKQAFRFGPEVTPEQRETILKLYDDSGSAHTSGVLAESPWGQLRYEIVPYADEAETPDDVDVLVNVGVRPADAPADWSFVTDVKDSESHLSMTEAELSKLRSKLAAIGGGQVTAAAGADVTPGHDELHHWWTRGKGRALWVESPEPWTTLVAQLMEHVEGLTLARAKRWASKWYMEVFGFSAGSDKARVAHGKPPRGKVIGPG